MLTTNLFLGFRIGMSFFRLSDMKTKTEWIPVLVDRCCGSTYLKVLKVPTTLASALTLAGPLVILREPVLWNG